MEDPSIELSKPRFSFSEEPLKEPEFPQSYKGSRDEPSIDIKTVKIKNINFNDLLVPMKSNKKFDDLNELKSKIDNIPDDVFRKLRETANPFNFQPGIFLNRASIKLVNILWVFKLDGDNKPAADPRYSLDTDIFHFADIGAAPGGFTNVIQWKHPNNRGYGMSIESMDNSLNWNTKVIDTNRFDIITGPNRGDLYIGWKTLVDMAEKHPVTLLTADGGFDIDEKESRLKELHSTRLIACECIVGLCNVAESGHFVLKVYDLMTKTMLDLLYLLYLNYDEVFIFKPCSSRPFNSERYIVCRNRLSESFGIELLKEVLDTFNDDTHVTSIFGKLPKEFINWVDQHNKFSYENQTKYLNVILGEPLEEKYILDDFYVLWGIPSSNRLGKTVYENQLQKFIDEEKELGKKSSGKLLLDKKQKTQYTKHIDGEQLFNIFVSFLQNKIMKADKSKRPALIKEIKDHCLELCLGKPNDPKEYPESHNYKFMWKHELEGNNYIFSYGQINLKFIKSKIDYLLELEDITIKDVYKLVERYTPLFAYNKQILGLNPKASIEGIEAFTTPLTSIHKKKYFSYFDEDKKFGSLGIFFNGNIENTTLFIFPPKNIFVYNRLLEYFDKPKKNTTINIIIDEVNHPIITNIKAHWKYDKVEVKMLDYITGGLFNFKDRYIEAQRIYE